MAIARSAPEVGQWLAALLDERRAAVEEVRALARASTASLYEIVYHRALGYSTSASSHDRVVYVSMSTNHMTLGFFFGTSLTDPEHVLRGTGTRMRHVQIRRAEDTRNPTVKQLVRQALDDGPRLTAELRERRRASP